MMIVGLTGGIGMGKSTVAGLFADEGIPVWDADAAVHELYAPGGVAVAPVESRFGGVMTGQGGIDREALSQRLLADPASMDDLNAIVHPLIARHREAFLAAQDKDTAFVVLDIPLLFETGTHAQADVIIVCTAPEAVRRARVLARDAMTLDKYDHIVARQAPDEEKRMRADYLIYTDKGVEEARRRVANLIPLLRARAGSPRAQKQG